VRPLQEATHDRVEAVPYTGPSWNKPLSPRLILPVRDFGTGHVYFHPDTVDAVLATLTTLLYESQRDRQLSVDAWRRHLGGAAKLLRFETYWESFVTQPPFSWPAWDGDDPNGKIAWSDKLRVQWRKQNQATLDRVRADVKELEDKREGLARGELERAEALLKELYRWLRPLADREAKHEREERRDRKVGEEYRRYCWYRDLLLPVLDALIAEPIGVGDSTVSLGQVAGILHSLPARQARVQLGSRTYAMRTLDVPERLEGAEREERRRRVLDATHERFCVPRVEVEQAIAGLLDDDGESGNSATTPQPPGPGTPPIITGRFRRLPNTDLLPPDEGEPA
jgi:hypothetical protein